MKTTILLPLIFATFNLFAADKVTCYKYNEKKGTYKESSKKSCNNKSWFASEAEAKADAEKECLAKEAKGKVKWDASRGICNKIKNLNKLHDKCEKEMGKLKEHQGHEYNFTFGKITLDSKNLEVNCSDISNTELKSIKKLNSCMKKLEKMNAKIDKKNAGDKQSIMDVFQDGKCDKKKIRQSKGVSDKRCENLKEKIAPELVTKFGLDNICENPSKADLKTLKQLNKCERKVSKGKSFVFDPKSYKCINLKKNEDLGKVEIKPLQLSEAKKAQCLKLTLKMKSKAQGDFVPRKNLEKLKKKGCLDYTIKM